MRVLNATQLILFTKCVQKSSSIRDACSWLPSVYASAILTEARFLGKPQSMSPPRDNNKHGCFADSGSMVVECVYLHGRRKIQNKQTCFRNRVPLLFVRALFSSSSQARSSCQNKWTEQKKFPECECKGQSSN
jgi:hypothetical protein